MDVCEIVTEFDKLVQEYEDLFKESEEPMVLDGKTISEALKSQIILELSYELMSKKLSHLYDQCETEVESAYSDAVKDAMSDRYKEVTFTEAKVYAKANPTYKASVSLMHDIRHIRDECKGLESVVRSRKYILNNLTNLVVAGSENHIL